MEARRVRGVTLSCFGGPPSRMDTWILYFWPFVGSWIWIDQTNCWLDWNMSAGLPLTLWYVQSTKKQRPSMQMQAGAAVGVGPCSGGTAALHKPAAGRHACASCTCCMHMCVRARRLDRTDTDPRVRSRRCNVMHASRRPIPCTPPQRAVAAACRHNRDTTRHSRRPGRIGVRLEDHWSPLRTRTTLFAAATHRTVDHGLHLLARVDPVRAVQCIQVPATALALLAEYSPCTARLG